MEFLCDGLSEYIDIYEVLWFECIYIILYLSHEEIIPI